ncbi:hypothetical protein ACS0TY_000272 [Phlomoides rotata]
MSMSLFSSFEAFCAESFGHKVDFSPAPAFFICKQDPAKIEELSKGKDVNSASTDRRRIRTPRFAVELDGLNCFETILPF